MTSGMESDERFWKPCVIARVTYDKAISHQLPWKRTALHKSAHLPAAFAANWSRVAYCLPNFLVPAHTSTNASATTT